MEIFFCSHCNQSIPLKDIQSGVAELRRGKYLCVTCKEIVSASREKAPNYAAMYLGIFLAGTLIVIGYLIFQEDLFPVPEPTRSAAPHDRNAILDSLEDLKTEFRDDFQKTKDQMSEGFRLFEDRLNKQSASLTLTQSIIRTLQESRGERVSAADVLMLKNRIQALSRSLKILGEDLGRIGVEVEGIRKEMKNAVESTTKAAVEVEPAPEVSEVDRWIAQLTEKVPGKRFNAVAELSRFKDPKVDRALVGCLKDEDFFIRRFVAEELGERKAVFAAQALWEALGDEEISVREAAVQALRKITGKTFGFKSGASGRERARAMGKWRNHIAGLLKRK